MIQVLGRFEPTLIETHQALNTMCKVKSLKSCLKKSSFLEDIITSSNVVCIDWESDMVVGI